MNSVNLLELTDSWRDYRGIYPYIVQLGAGGTGAYVVQHICQILSTSGVQGSYVIADPDVIEEKNLKNQLFLPSEVGLKKADVLASRYSAAFDLDIGVFSDSYVESPDQLKNLIATEYMNYRIPSDYIFLPIFVGCVDNNFTRKVIHELFSILKRAVWIDAGNESAKVPSDWLTRPKSQWTEEELNEFEESGWSGQVVTGVRLDRWYQKSVSEAFPDVLSDDDEIKPSQLSCTELTASEPQRMIVNKFAALAIANALTEIVENHRVGRHITFFHAKKGYMRSTEINFKKEEQMPI